MQYSGPALHDAIYNNNQKEFDLQLSQSSNFNMVDSNGDNVVHLAVRMNRLDMLKRLVEAGADVNIINKMHQPAIEIAFDNTNEEILRYLLKNGANPNEKFRDGTTILHNLVKSLDVMDLIPLAMAAGAMTNVQDRRGNTPIHNAVQHANTKKDKTKEYTEIAINLIELVPQYKMLFQPNLLRKSPLDIAIKSNNKPIINAIEKKALKLSERIPS